MGIEKERINLDKKLLIVLVIVFAAGIFISGFNLPADAFSGTLAITLVLIIAFIIILLWPANPLKKISETETIGVDTEATTDSRICEKITWFMGIPLIFVFGGVWRKYESIFSVKYGGENIVVLYQGICLVSKNDKLRITGAWYAGKTVGVEKNVVVASRIENISSGIVFDDGK